MRTIIYELRQAIQTPLALMPNPNGRPKIPAPLKKVPVGIKLPRWLLEWTGKQTESRAQLIEDALIRAHKLKPPE